MMMRMGLPIFDGAVGNLQKIMWLRWVQNHLLSRASLPEIYSSAQLCRTMTVDWSVSCLSQKASIIAGASLCDVVLSSQRTPYMLAFPPRFLPELIFRQPKLWGLAPFGEANQYRATSNASGS
jgi:hypothetical protein